MLRFNQRGWFKLSPDAVDPVTPAVDPGEVVGPTPATETSYPLPIPSTSKEYYLAKIAGLVGEDAPISEIRTEQRVWLIRNESVEFTETETTGHFKARCEFDEEVAAKMVQIGEHPDVIASPDNPIVVAINGTPAQMISGSDPTYPIDGYEVNLSSVDGVDIVEIYTGINSAGSKTIDMYINCHVEPQPKTRDEYYLAKQANVFIADESLKRHDSQLTDETELALDELDPDSSGLDRWPHGMASFTTDYETVDKTNKIIVNGDQEAASLQGLDSPIPESGYMSSVYANKINHSVDITIWHIGSTDTTEVINFVCVDSELTEDIPEPKTRSEVYDYAIGVGSKGITIPEPCTRKEFYNYMRAGKEFYNYMRAGGEPTTEPPEPKTRTEAYYAALALGREYDGEIPEPKTPTEFYLAVKAGWEPQKGSIPASGGGKEPVAPIADDTP